MNNRSFFYCIDNQIFENDRLIQSNIDSQSLQLFHSYVTFQNLDGYSFFYYIKKKEQKKIDFHLIDFINDEKGIGYYDISYTINGASWKTGIVEISTMNIIETFDLLDNFAVIKTKNDYMFGLQNNLLKMFLLNTKEINWQYDVIKEGKWFNWHERNWITGEISEVLGVYESVLWISLKSDLILGIDIETGVILHRFESPVSIRNEKTDAGQEERLPLGRYAQLDVKNEKILIIDNKKLVEINIGSSQPEKEIFDIEESMSAFGFERQIAQGSWKFDNDYIYFYDNGELTRMLRVGIFDRKSRRVVSSTIIETESRGINLVKDFGIYQNDIYVLDMNSTLWKLSISELLGES